MSSDTTHHEREEYTDLLDPCGEVSVEGRAIAERVDSLSGKTVGLLDNSKSNANHLLDGIATVLQAEYGVSEVVYRRKDKSPIPAGSIADQLAAQCDAVVNAYGDCGSCTSWCVYDSIDLEQKDVPVATINSDEFVKLGQSEARSLGMPGLPLVTVPHPMGDIPEEEVRERARDIVKEVVAVLTTDRDEIEEAYEDRYLGADEELQAEDLYCPI